MFRKKQSFIGALFIALITAALVFTGCPTDPGTTPDDGIVPAAPDTPTVLSADGMLAVRWTAVDGASSYEIYYNASNTTPAGTADQTVSTTFADITGLTNDSSGTRYVWIKAKNNAGTSDFSPVASGTPAALVIPNELKGYHQSAYGDGFEIDDTAKTFYAYDNRTGAISFAGAIVSVLPDDDTDGRIIFKITDTGSWGKAENYYYTVAYKDLTAFAVSEGGASGTDWMDPINNGLPTLAEAINEYTTANDYFGYAAYYHHPGASPRSTGALAGKWYYEDYDMYVTINGTSYVEWMDGDEEYDGVYDPTADESDMLSIEADIVDHTPIDTESGILYLKALSASEAGAVNEKYYAIAWTNRDGSSIKFMNPADDYDTLEAVKDAKNDPANESQFSPAGFFDYEKQ